MLLSFKLIPHFPPLSAWSVQASVCCPNIKSIVHVWRVAASQWKWSLCLHLNVPSGSFDKTKDCLLEVQWQTGGKGERLVRRDYCPLPLGGHTTKTTTACLSHYSDVYNHVSCQHTWLYEKEQIQFQNDRLFLVNGSQNSYWMEWMSGRAIFLKIRQALQISCKARLRL